MPRSIILYDIWNLILHRPHDPAFNEYNDFFWWAIENGYGKGKELYRLDEEKPYSPDNCGWRQIDYNTARANFNEKEFVEKWNKAVNRIRLHYGMDPLPVSTEPEPEQAMEEE